MNEILDTLHILNTKTYILTMKLVALKDVVPIEQTNEMLETLYEYLIQHAELVNLLYK